MLKQNNVIPHFSWTISANEKMQFHSEILLNSFKEFKSFEATIWVPNFEYDKISKELKNKVEVLPYDPDPIFLDPWGVTPKWDVKPRGDVVVGLDADVMVWSAKNCQKDFNLCYNQNSICATMAYKMPNINFKNEWTIQDWENLSKKFNIKLNYDYWSIESNQKGPFYFNNGAVLIPKNLLNNFRNSLKYWLKEINKYYKDLYFFAQVANVFVINQLNLKHISMPNVFNYLEIFNREMKQINDVSFLHFNYSRDFLINKKCINKIQNKILKQKLSKMFNFFV